MTAWSRYVCAADPSDVGSVRTHTAQCRRREPEGQKSSGDAGAPKSAVSLSIYNPFDSVCRPIMELTVAACAQVYAT